MGLRVRKIKSGKQYREIVCAAENPPLPGDDYLDETMHSSILQYAYNLIVDGNGGDYRICDAPRQPNVPKFYFEDEEKEMILSWVWERLFICDPGLCWECKLYPENHCERCDGWSLKVRDEYGKVIIPNKMMG